jgi:hypothetical protein
LLFWPSGAGCGECPGIRQRATLRLSTCFGQVLRRLEMPGKPGDRTKRSRNVIDNRLLLFLEFDQSRNVYENKGGYLVKAGMLLINEVLMGSRCGARYTFC